MSYINISAYSNLKYKNLKLSPTVCFSNKKKKTKNTNQFPRGGGGGGGGGGKGI